jgi:hypothetical protein
VHGGLLLGCLPFSTENARARAALGEARHDLCSKMPDFSLLHRAYDRNFKFAALVRETKDIAARISTLKWSQQAGSTPVGRQQQEASA